MSYLNDEELENRASFFAHVPEPARTHLVEFLRQHPQNYAHAEHVGRLLINNAPTAKTEATFYLKSWGIESEFEKKGGLRQRFSLEQIRDKVFTVARRLTSR